MALIFHHYKRSVLMGVCLLPIIASTAVAESSHAASADELLELLNEQQSKITQQERQLKAQKKQMQRISSQIKSLQKNSELEVMRARGNETGPQPEPQKVGLERKPKPKEKPPEIEAVAYESGGGVLLAPGKAVLDVGTEYARSSAVRVAVEGFTIVPALNIGSFEIAEVDRDTFTGSVGMRLGVMKDLEIEARIPYVYREDSTISRPFGTGASSNVLSTVEGYGLGDIELGARYQIMRSDGDWPFLIGGLRFKTATGNSPFDVPTNATTGLQEELPTGSGFYALQPSLTAIMPSDPVVLYSSVGYLYNMPRDFGGTTGEIDPGDSISTSMGMGFSVNEKTSFSLGYSHDYVLETKQNGSTIRNSTPLHVGTLNTGFSYRITPKTSMNTNISAGLTDDAPDVRVVFRMPTNIDLY